MPPSAPVQECGLIGRRIRLDCAVGGELSTGHHTTPQTITSSWMQCPSFLSAIKDPTSTKLALKQNLAYEDHSDDIWTRQHYTREERNSYKQKMDPAMIQIGEPRFERTHHLSITENSTFECNNTLNLQYNQIIPMSLCCCCFTDQYCLCCCSCCYQYL